MWKQEGVSVFYFWPSFDPVRQRRQTLASCLRAVGGWSGSLLRHSANQERGQCSRVGGRKAGRKEEGRHEFNQSGGRAGTLGGVTNPKMHNLQCRIIQRGREWRPEARKQTVSRSPDPQKGSSGLISCGPWSSGLKSLPYEWVTTKYISSGSNPFPPRVASALRRPYKGQLQL